MLQMSGDAHGVNNVHLEVPDAKSRTDTLETGRDHFAVIVQKRFVLSLH